MEYCIVTKDNRTPEVSEIRVLVGHRYALFGAALASLLERGGFKVVDTATTNDALLSLAKEHKPQIVLMDWKMKGSNIECVRQLAATSQRAAVAMLIDPEAVQEFFPTMDAGVSGYLSKNMDEAKLFASLELIARGEVVLSREIAASLADADTNGHPHEHLTEREVQVLAMVGTGATNKEIGESLIITENTVKVHLRNILDKLNLRNRQQAAAYAAEQGIKADLPEEALHHFRPVG